MVGPLRFEETTVVPGVNGRGRRAGALFVLVTPAVEPVLNAVLIFVFLILITALPRVFLGWFNGSIGLEASLLRRFFGFHRFFTFSTLFAAFGIRVDTQFH